MIGITTILSTLGGIDLKKLLPIIPYVVAFGGGWFINGQRLGEARVNAMLAAKDTQIVEANIKIDTALTLAADKDLLIAEYKEAKTASDARVIALEGNLIELSLRQPKDTVKIIDNTREQADEIINNDASYDWLRKPYPSVMLNQTNRRIAESKNYGLSNAAPARDRSDWPQP